MKTATQTYTRATLGRRRTACDLVGFADTLAGLLLDDPRILERSLVVEGWRVIVRVTVHQGDAAAILDELGETAFHATDFE